MIFNKMYRKLRSFFIKSKSGLIPMQSRINSLSVNSEGAILKRAGVDFERNGIAFDAKSLVKREAYFLNLLKEYEYFPNVLEEGEDFFTMTHEGELISAKNLPENWEEQIKKIISALEEKDIVHRDIKQQNILVKNNIIKLIDFGWAIHSSEKENKCPQDFSKHLSREMIYDNKKALYKTIEDLRSLN